MNRLPDFFMLTVAAPRGSGKSHLARKMVARMYEEHWFDKYAIMSPSTDVNQDYDDFMELEDVEIYSSGIEAKIEHLISEMTSCKRRVVAAARQVNASLDEITMKCPRLLILLDDIIDSSVVNFGGIVDVLAERGRHINIACIIASQRISAVSRSIRINSDAFIVFSPFSKSETEQFIEQFASRSVRKAIRKAIEDVFTKQYEFILVDNGEYNPSKKLKHSNADAFVDRDKTWQIHLPQE